MRKLLIAAIAALVLFGVGEKAFQAAAPVQDFGWQPPPTPEERHELYGDSADDQSLKQCAPHLFQGANEQK